MKRKAKPGKFSISKVAPDLISLLFLANLTRKLYGNRKALKELRKIVLSEKPINSEAYIRKHFKLSVPLVIVTKMEHVKSRVTPALIKIGIDEATAQKIQSRLHFAFPHVLEGNGFASLIADKTGKKMFALVAVPPKANEFLLRHELGHVIYRLKEGRPMIKGFKLSTEPWLRSISFLSRVYSKKSKYGIEKEEKVAWDLAGVPKDNPLRKSAQKSYETAMGFSTAGLKWILVSAFSPEIRKWARKLEASLRGEKLKEDVLIEKSKSKYAKLKDNRRPLTPEERAEVMGRKAIWHHGPNGEPSPAVWKSVNPTTGEVTFITNTHRAYQARPTLKGAIGIYHKFIKTTA